MTPDQHKQLTALAQSWQDCSDNRLRGAGDNLQSWLNANAPEPSVSVAALESWKRNGWVTVELDALIRSAMPKPALPPNLHQQGTYLWAREEYARKTMVRRHGQPAVGKFGNVEWDDQRWTHADFTATDWEVVD